MEEVKVTDENLFYPCTDDTTGAPSPRSKYHQIRDDIVIMIRITV
jgi:hypothetical protein